MPLQGATAIARQELLGFVRAENGFRLGIEVNVNVRRFVMGCCHNLPLFQCSNTGCYCDRQSRIIVQGKQLEELRNLASGKPLARPANALRGDYRRFDDSHVSKWRGIDKWARIERMASDNAPTLYPSNGEVLAYPVIPRQKNRGLFQAYYVRDTCIEQLEELKTEPLGEKETLSARAQAKAALIKAWDCATDRIRIMKGRPMPGSLRPERRAPKRKAQVHAITEAPEQGTDVGTTSRPKDSTENKSS